MLLKRLLILASGVLLFIGFFVVYFEIVNAGIEGRFHDERVKYGVEGVDLTAVTPVNVPPPRPAETRPMGGGSAVPTTPPSADPNTIIGPVPPPSTTTPTDSNPPSSTPSDSTPPANTPPPSTLNLPSSARSPFLAAAYHPGEEFATALAGAEATQVVAPPEPVAGPLANSNTIVAPTAPAISVPTGTLATGVETGGIHPGAGDASVIVLLYHQFVPPGVSVPSRLQWTMPQDVFASEMKYLKDNNYHVVPMADLIRFLKHEINLPPNSVVITIDDGYKSAIVYAAPILKQYGFPWTFFVYPDFITVNESKGAASWNDLLALQAEGIDIESHSMTHPKLTSKKQKFKGPYHTLTPGEYDEFLTNETLGAKTLLEQKLNHPVTCFAYPFGDFNKQVEAKAIAAGYQYIFTVAGNPVHSTTNPYSIGRYTITQGEEKNFTAYLRQSALALSAVDPAPGSTTSNPRPVITAVLDYAGKVDPEKIETTVGSFGAVRHDFDPRTSTLRLYLPADLIQPVVLVGIQARDAQTGQLLVANWRFDYAVAPGAATHPPIGATNAAPVVAPAPVPQPVPPPTTTKTSH